MATSFFRVGGGYTTINFGSTPLAFVDMIRETAPQPVSSAQPIQPIDAAYPIEIALPPALQAGMLEVQIREQWAGEVWTVLGKGFDTAQDLLGVFSAQLGANATTNKLTNITVTKIINSPNAGVARAIQYSGIVVVNVQLDETINIGTMTLPKSISMMYTRRQESYGSTFNSASLSIKSGTPADFASTAYVKNPLIKTL